MAVITQQLMPYAYFQKKIRPSKEAVIPLSAHSLQYGTACFSGIRGYLRDGKIRLFRSQDHFERVMNAVKILGMDFKMTYEEFDKIITQMIRKNQPKSDLYVRMIVFCQDPILSPRFDGLKFDMGIYMAPLGDYLDTSRGLKLMISHWMKFPDASAPTKTKANGMYVQASLARSEAATNGYDEALVMDYNWNIVEASAENILIVYRGRVIMPPLGSAMLEGVTLRTVIDLLKEENMPIHFEPIDRSMVYTCDELLLTGTAAQVLFAESVDKRLIRKTMGPVATMLRKKFADLVAMKHPRSKEWVREYSFSINN